MNSTTLDALAAFPGQLEAHYASIPAEFTHWAPPSWEGVPSEPGRIHINHCKQESTKPCKIERQID